MELNNDESGCHLCLLQASNPHLLGTDERIMQDIPFRGRNAEDWEREVAPYTRVSTLLWTCACGGQWHSNRYHHVLTIGSCETPEPWLSDALWTSYYSVDLPELPLDSYSDMPVADAWMLGRSANEMGDEEPPTSIFDQMGAFTTASTSQPGRRQMRDIKACDMCRKNRKTCETWHPGQRRDWKEWDNMSNSLKRTASETATRLARDKAAMTCDACRVENVECQAAHEGAKSSLRKWLQMSSDEKRTASGDASQLNGGWSG